MSQVFYCICLYFTRRRWLGNFFDEMSTISLVNGSLYLIPFAWKRAIPKSNRTCLVRGGIALTEKVLCLGSQWTLVQTYFVIFSSKAKILKRVSIEIFISNPVEDFDRSSTSILLFSFIFQVIQLPGNNKCTIRCNAQPTSRPIKQIDLTELSCLRFFFASSSLDGSKEHWPIEKLLIERTIREVIIWITSYWV